MKAFKNTIQIQLNQKCGTSYVKAAVNPNSDYYFECTLAEVDWAVSTGAVTSHGVSGGQEMFSANN